MGRDEHGVVSSSPLAVTGAAAVLVAALVYLATTPPKPPEPVELTVAPQQVERQVTFERVRTEPSIRRGDTYVVVFNNSGVTGLAGRTSDRLSQAGWKVVGSDNWYGTIPASTVYYPPGLQRQARLLAEDLDLGRVRPAIDPMQMDRLTVILTSDAG